jgi:hypothetical protein
MVLVNDTRSTGLDSIGKESNVEVPRDVLNKMQEWASSRDFDEDDMLDMHRTKEFGEYLVDLERHSNENDVTIYYQDSIACVDVSEFLEI